MSAGNLPLTWECIPFSQNSQVWKSYVVLVEGVLSFQMSVYIAKYLKRFKSYDYNCEQMFVEEK